MSFISSVDEKEANYQFNLDDLFEKKRNQDLQQKSTFDKILRRVYDRIKATSRMRPKEQYIFYQVPFMMWGVSTYNYGECIAYLSTKLMNDGFHVKYVPELWIFVSWKTYVPTYVRSELRKKTGIQVNEQGKIVHMPDAIKGQNERQDPQYEPHVLPNGRIVQQPKKNKPEFVPTSRYQPKGELVYGQERFDQIERKVTFQTPSTTPGISPSFRPSFASQNKNRTSQSQDDMETVIL